MTSTPFFAFPPPTDERLDDRREALIEEYELALAILADAREGLDEGTTDAGAVAQADATSTALREALDRVDSQLAERRADRERTRVYRAHAERLARARESGERLLAQAERLPDRYAEARAAVAAVADGLLDAHAELARAYVPFAAECHELMPRYFKRTRRPQEYDREPDVPAALAPVLAALEQRAGLADLKREWTPTGGIALVAALVDRATTPPKVTEGLAPGVAAALTEARQRRASMDFV